MEDKLEKMGVFKALKPLLYQSCLTSKGIYNLIRFFKQVQCRQSWQILLEAELVAQPPLEVAGAF